MLQRAQERATLELGPETHLELRAKLEAEVAAERFTRAWGEEFEEALERIQVRGGHSVTQPVTVRSLSDYNSMWPSSTSRRNT